LKIALSALLHKLGRHAEVAELVETLASLEMLSPSEQVTVFNLRALLAEDRGDLRAALDHQREAFALERSLLERRAEESLRNAQIIARTDLLEREADIERERRRRLEHELAEVVMELSDSRRIISALEQRLRKALEHAGPDAGSAAVGALRQALSDLHADAAPHESPLRYLGDVDRDFCRRMRSRWPDLTPKQERLCALTRAGLASKEIASLMDLEPEGLKAQRKRLRRKLGLSPGERLEVVLADL
jgi:DNA-binding CsgD family transcriptional regulator